MKSYKASKGYLAHKRSRTLKKILVVGLVLAGVAGCYIGLLILSPSLLISFGNRSDTELSRSAVKTEDRLYIPKLKLNIPYNAGKQDVLMRGAWHRFPDRGNPQSGGNFILAGHRFNLGITPAGTKARSPFYRLNILILGDPIFVDYNGKRYEYKVTKKYTVKPTQVEIESKTAEAKMTLYTCTVKGAADGREVIDAVLVNKDVDITKTF